MDNGIPLEPTTPSSQRKLEAQRRRASERARDRRNKRPLGPGQLHLLVELLQENSRDLTSFELGADGSTGFKLASNVPHLVDFIEFQVETLRQQQEALERLYLADDGR